MVSAKLDFLPASSRRIVHETNPAVMVAWAELIDLADRADMAGDIPDFVHLLELARCAHDSTAAPRRAWYLTLSLWICCELSIQSNSID
jgi:hypothetical protein